MGNGGFSRVAVAALLVTAGFAVSAASASAVVVQTPDGALSYTPVPGARGAVAASPCGLGCNGSGRQQLKLTGAPIRISPFAVLPSTTTYFVYWDPQGAQAFPTGYESGITTFFKGLAAENGSDQSFYSILTQYYGTEPVKYETHYGKAITDKQPYPAEAGKCSEAGVPAPCVNNDQIIGELERLVKAGTLPGNYTETQTTPRQAVFVMLPPGTKVCVPFGCSPGFCAYHTYYEEKPEYDPEFEPPPTPPPGGWPYGVYGVIPYDAGTLCDSGQHPNGVSDAALDGGLVHEFAEMITDAFVPRGWTNEEGSGQEIADICEEGQSNEVRYGTPLGTAPNGALYNQVVAGRDYYYQQMWSNETGSCVQRRALPPIVSKLSAKKGPAGGGTAVKITGLNFKNPDVTAVHFGTVAASKFTIESGSWLTVETPPAAVGKVSVTVTTSAGTSATTKAGTFQFFPTVSAVSPSGGPTAGGTSVTLTGTGFVPGTAGTKIKFGTTRATSVNCISTTTCTATAPAHAAGTVDVKVSVTGGASPAEVGDQYTYS
jgi:hypothetical protein